MLFFLSFDYLVTRRKSLSSLPRKEAMVEIPPDITADWSFFARHLQPQKRGAAMRNFPTGDV